MAFDKESLKNLLLQKFEAQGFVLQLESGESSKLPEFCDVLAEALVDFLNNNLRVRSSEKFVKDVNFTNGTVTKDYVYSEVE